LRDLVAAYWAGNPVTCPRHAAPMTGSFVQTTFADHVFLVCSRGKETITIPQRPRQMKFHDQQVEGMVENIQRGDTNLCYRCQSQLETAKKEDPVTGRGTYTFTCVRCLSWGTWNGHPDEAKIGSAPTSGTNKKAS
ncbi:MAG TPA: hypothetical protein VFL80_07520, partial [Thermoanaerobaculia bacterium]|nr:hypothetical protein [Thermoanaerobaculia bacterium]